MHKYEQSKEEEPLVVVPKKYDEENAVRGEEEEETDEDELTLQRMLSTLRQPEKLLREELSSLR